MPATAANGWATVDINIRHSVRADKKLYERLLQGLLMSVGKYRKLNSQSCL